MSGHYYYEEIIRHHHEALKRHELQSQRVAHARAGRGSSAQVAWLRRLVARVPQRSRGGLSVDAQRG